MFYRGRMTEHPDWLAVDTSAADSIDATTLHDGVSDGVRIVTLRAGDFEATICPTRGLGVLSLDRVGSDPIRAAWTSPIAGPVHPQWVDLGSRGGLGWLDGFTELVARCGLSFNGPPGHDENAPPLEERITLHGRIANRPASDVRVTGDGEAVAISGTVREVTLFGAHLELRSTIRLSDDGTLAIEDTVTNRSARPAEMQLLYHINLDPHCVGERPTLTTPGGEVEPRDAAAEAGFADWRSIDPPADGYAEQVFFVTPEGGGGFSTTRLSGDRGGVEVSQRTETLPHLAIWKCLQPRVDGYVLGIEPATGFPNFKAEERKAGRVVRLKPGQSRLHEVTIRIASD